MNQDDQPFKKPNENASNAQRNSLCKKIFNSAQEITKLEDIRARKEFKRLLRQIAILPDEMKPYTNFAVYCRLPDNSPYKNSSLKSIFKAIERLPSDEHWAEAMLINSYAMRERRGDGIDLELAEYALQKAIKYVDHLPPEWRYGATLVISYDAQSSKTINKATKKLLEAIELLPLSEQFEATSSIISLYKIKGKVRSEVVKKLQYLECVKT